jgi:hypothetical protein
MVVPPGFFEKKERRVPLLNGDKNYKRVFQEVFTPD